MLKGLFVQGLGRHVDAIGPRDGPGLRIDANLSEVTRVGEGLEYPPPFALVERDIADRAVLEGEAQAVLSDYFYAGDVDQWLHEVNAREGGRSE